MDTVLKQSLGVRIIERILDISDYFIYKKHVTLSESFLFVIVFARAIWYSIFGMTGGVLDSIFTVHVWAGVFIALAVAHIAAFAFKQTFVRSLIVASYACLWMFLTILATASSSNTPAAPTFAAFTLMAVIVAYRLYKDKPYVS